MNIDLVSAIVFLVLAVAAPIAGFEAGRWYGRRGYVRRDAAGERGSEGDAHEP